MAKSKPKPKQKLKQDDRTAQLEQQLLAVVKQNDEKIAQLNLELAEMKQLKDRIAQLEQQSPEVKPKQQEEQETKSRRCKEQMEKPVGQNQTGVPTVHSSKPVAGEREQPQIRSFKDILLGDRGQTAREHEKEFMDRPLKKPHESFEHSKKNLTPPAEIPLLYYSYSAVVQLGGEDQTQPVGEDQTQPVGEDQTQPVGEYQTQPLGSLCGKTEVPSWFDQSEATNFKIVVDIPERTNNGISEHENEILENALGDPLDPIALHQTNPIQAQNIATIPCATPVFVPNVQLERLLVLRELFKATKCARALTLIDEKIVSKLRTRFKDTDFKDHNRKSKLKHPIQKYPVHMTVRTIYFLKLAKPSQSDFDSKKYRREHPFPYFENGSYEYDFYNRIRGGDGDQWLKVVEETAKKSGKLEWQYFKSCELIAQVNHEVHPVIAPEKLISSSKQHGFNCRGVDLGIIVEYMANSLMAMK